MRLAMVSAAALALGLFACSASPNDDAASSSSNETVGSAPVNAACSLEYWHWYLNDLRPQLAKSIDEVSDAQMTALVAKHPAMGETASTYSVCWQPAFAEAFVGNALYRLNQASIAYVDRSSPSYNRLADYKTNIALTPEMRRNAKAMLALKPSTMSPSDTSTFTSTYDMVIAQAIKPIGQPGLYMYEDVTEAEWVVNDQEAEYLSIVEQSASASSADGSYAEWFGAAESWILGPPMALSNSFVFNVAWEPGAESSWQGLHGIQTDNGKPSIPAPVQQFIDRLNKTAPAAIGSEDSSAWMNWYYARGLRTVGDLSQNEPLLTSTDKLALDVLESMKPAKLRGAQSYGSWLDLMKLAATASDASLTGRFAAMEPCVDAADLDQAKKDFAAKPPTVCAE